MLSWIDSTLNRILATTVKMCLSSFFLLCRKVLLLTFYVSCEATTIVDIITAEVSGANEHYSMIRTDLL